jgi:Domain of unknown function (DUF4926)
MALPLLSIVRLTTDHYRDKGVGTGATGVIVEVYDDRAYEVEFSDPRNAETIGMFALPQGDVELVQAPENVPMSRTGD